MQYFFPSSKGINSTRGPMSLGLNFFPLALALIFAPEPKEGLTGIFIDPSFPLLFS